MLVAVVFEQRCYNGGIAFPASIGYEYVFSSRIPYLVGRLDTVRILEFNNAASSQIYARRYEIEIARR